MDVRCEKCQTEYELDEARLKPGGVTVKCTNCGHMFKIRRRPTTAVGAPPGPEPRPRSSSSKPGIGPPPRADSVLDDPRTLALSDEGPTTIERQWLIRLENGEQKSCRELATLQQWIVACVVSRESLISRTGKTWKRLGDIAELAQYFEIADEARTTREDRRMSPPGRPVQPAGPAPGRTMIGVVATPPAGGAPQAAGGTILPDDDDERPTVGNFQRGRVATPPPPPKVPLRTPPMGSGVAPPPVTPPLPPGAVPPPAILGAPGATPPPPVPPVSGQPSGLAAPRRPSTTPPPPPPRRTSLEAAQLPPPLPPDGAQGPSGRGPAVPPAGGRATAMWVNDAVVSDGVQRSQPFGGKIAAIPDEPAFAAGRVRIGPSEQPAFDSARVSTADDDDELLPRRRGSRAGVLLLVLLVLVGGATAGVIYVFVIGKDASGTAERQPARLLADAAVVAADAPAVVAAPADAAPAPAPSPAELARGEIAPDNEPRLRAALQSLGTGDEPAAHAMRAQLGAAIAQSLIDRAGLAPDAKLRNEARTLAVAAANAAQRAHKAAPDDPAANLAMAQVLRLQGKPARDIKRYLDAARARPGDWARDIALAEALVLARDGKLDDAKAMLAAIDDGDGKLESSGDVRPRFHLALIALAQNRSADAKLLIDQVLAAQPEHLGARALVAKLDTLVSSSDPLPPEDDRGSTAPGPPTGTGSAPRPPPAGGQDVAIAPGDSYEKIIAKANKIADANCTKASELFRRALELKPNGVEALTGLGYCLIDAKEYHNAFSKFRSALAVIPRYEPALAGIAEGYQQMGRAPQAIEAWRAYLEVFPGSPKAKRQLEMLGVTDAGGSPAPPSGGASPPAGSAAPPAGSAAAPPPAAPAPSPAPAPSEPAGSGSG